MSGSVVERSFPEHGTCRHCKDLYLWHRQNESGDYPCVGPDEQGCAVRCPDFLEDGRQS